MEILEPEGTGIGEPVPTGPVGYWAGPVGLPSLTVSVTVWTRQDSETEAVGRVGASVS